MKLPLLLLLAFVHCARALTASSSAIAWRTEYEAALAEAHDAGQPVLLDFSASWCGPCRLMEATTFADPAIQRALKKYVTVRVDFDQNTALVGKYKVQAIPTLILLNRFGELVASQTGYLDADKFSAWLTLHANEASAAVSKAQLEQQKMQALQNDLDSPDPAQRERGLAQVLEGYVAKDESAPAVELILKSLIAKRAPELLPHLNDKRLAVRIFLGNLFAQKLGPDFQFDPWEETEARAAVIASWQEKVR